MRIKELVRLFVPPVFFVRPDKLRLRGLAAESLVEWEYVPEGWEYIRKHPEVKGWNVNEVLQVCKSKWPKFVSMVQSTGPLGIAHESDLSTNTDIYSHNGAMSFGYAVGLAAHSLDSLSMLDWGGGIGHYYLFAKALLPNVEIDYHCKDTPLLAGYGAQLLPQQHFYSDESCLNSTYDFVMANTSMHYTEDWQSLLLGLARSTRRYLYVACLPTVLEAASFVFVQRPYAYGYNTEYLAWCLNQAEFLKYARNAGLELVREFVYGYAPRIHRAPEQNQYRGYLFRPLQGERDK